jgi:predicted aminopeptidase
MKIGSPVLGATLLVLAGCFQADYVLQAAEGQLDLACRARSIDSARRDPDVHPRVRALLGEVARMKAFSKRQGLVPTDSYEDFVDLDRDAVVYVVTAAPQLSLEPIRWDFPIVGSVPYLGWFDEMEAKQQAAKLRKKGYDVYLRGASAYSTLGWFNDPVLSSMIEEGDEAAGGLADTIIHESVHATVYVKDQSEFNESLAAFVAEKLTPVFLTERYGAGSTELQAYLEAESRAATIRKRFEDAYAHLKALYASKRPRSQKLAEKKRYLEELRSELGIGPNVNNARLAGYDSYHGGDDAFAEMLARCGSIQAMIEAVKTAKPTDFEKEQVDDILPVARKLAARCKK